MAILALCVVAVSFISTSALEMVLFHSPMKGQVNETVKLECKVSGYSSPQLQLKTVGVQWIFTSTRKEVYSYIGGKASASRNGATISEDNLRTGDASLYLPNIQIEDEGDYTCVVIVTPEKVEKTSTLQVSARPNVILFPQPFTALLGSTTFVKCSATGFYPQELEIIWYKISHEKMENISTKSYNKGLIENNDKMFSISSLMPIQPTLDDTGSRYRCVVKHRSLPENHMVEAKLIVQECKNRNTDGIIGGVIVLLVCVSLCIGYFTWVKWQKGAPTNDVESNNKKRKFMVFTGKAKSQGASLRAAGNADPGSKAQNDGKISSEDKHGEGNFPDKAETKSESRSGGNGADFEQTGAAPNEDETTNEKDTLLVQTSDVKSQESSLCAAEGMRVTEATHAAGDSGVERNPVPRTEGEQSEQAEEKEKDKSKDKVEVGKNNQAGKMASTEATEATGDGGPEINPAPQTEGGTGEQAEEKGEDKREGKGDVGKNKEATEKTNSEATGDNGAAGNPDAQTVEDKSTEKSEKTKEKDKHEENGKVAQKNEAVATPDSQGTGRKGGNGGGGKSDTQTDGNPPSQESKQAMDTTNRATGDNEKAGNADTQTVGVNHLGNNGNPNGNRIDKQRENGEQIAQNNNAVATPDSQGTGRKGGNGGGGKSDTQTDGKPPSQETTEMTNSEATGANGEAGNPDAQTVEDKSSEKSEKTKEKDEREENGKVAQKNEAGETANSEGTDTTGDNAGGAQTDEQQRSQETVATPDSQGTGTKRGNEGGGKPDTQTDGNQSSQESKQGEMKDHHEHGVKESRRNSTEGSDAVDVQVDVSTDQVN
ncbi:uncharacterized protein DDB_G0290685-like isoform X6 [Callorhinchus milii]|uniref:uncharacterized protein DDB_G0290685-like isoform X6 n=1 Tax=Callorhinchus milii TaxID=7868 RepID=UPI001C3FF09A|nr:uncharacterized protein DDB_G0290685-like isoform X6 [Callorhinchus milii]